MPTPTAARRRPRRSPSPFPAFASLLLLSASSLVVSATPSLFELTSDSSTPSLSELIDKGTFGSKPVHHFHSTPLRPPYLNIRTPKRGRDYEGEKLLTFIGARGHDAVDPAPYLYDEEGEPVWEGKKGNVMLFGKHRYRGKDVLAYYTGSEEFPGYGRGQWQIYDDTYSLIATVEAQKTAANSTDPHEFQITADDTAIIEYWEPRPADLTVIGGRADGWAFDCKVQEVDIATGELLFDWSTRDHIPLTETSYKLFEPEVMGGRDRPFDSAHLNSAHKDDAGNFLIGMRGPSTLYYVSGVTGDILWRLGGKESNFEMGENSRFFAQHNARIVGSGLSSSFLISVFDNGANQYEQIAHEARGLLLRVDQRLMRVTVEQEFRPSFRNVAPSEGSVQILSNGNVVVGWGIVPYYSEYTSNGTLVQNVQLGPDRTSLHSYRASKASWIGRPFTLPSFAVDTQRENRAYASWNGATEVTHWRLLGGSRPKLLNSLERTRKLGFETELCVEGRNDYFAVAAYDAKGKCLGVSETHHWSNGTSTGVAMKCSGVLLVDHTSLFLCLGLSLAMATYLMIRTRTRMQIVHLMRRGSRVLFYSPAQDGYESPHGEKTSVLMSPRMQRVNSPMMKQKV